MILAAVLAAATTASPQASPPVPMVRPAHVVIVWHLASAPYVDSTVRAAFIALAAPDALAPQLRALRAHPLARFSLAIDADALDGLARAAVGNTALQAMAAGRLGGDPRADDLMRVLAQVPALDAHVASTPAARRCQALAAAAPLALAGQRAARFSAADHVDFAGSCAIVRVAAAGALLASDPALQKNRLTVKEATAAVARLAALDAQLLQAIKDQSAAGRLELLADPAGEPILPLLVDGGGKSGANVVMLDAAADAATLVDAAMNAVKALAPASVPGAYSPHGAYDDETAAMLEQQHAAFALFSDRVLRASPIGGSRDAVAAADVAALHAYALRAAPGPALPVFFWSQDASAELDVLSTRLPHSAMGARVLQLARDAGARGGDAAVLVLHLDADGLWNRRADRAQVVDALAAVLASGAVDATTIGQYVRAHPPTATAYGFSPASDEGALTYWMGTTSQASMWNALSAARKAAGADAALDREATRAPLLHAEASRWYLVPSMLAPTPEIERLLEQYRALVREVYRGAGKPVPGNIAPVKLEAPSPVPSPAR